MMGARWDYSYLASPCWGFVLGEDSRFNVEGQMPDDRGALVDVGVGKFSSCAEVEASCPLAEELSDACDGQNLATLEALEETGRYFNLHSLKTKGLLKLLHDRLHRKRMLSKSGNFL